MSRYFGLSTENRVYHHAIAGPCCYEERTKQERNENALGDGCRIYWSILGFKPQDFIESHTQSARQLMMNGSDLPATKSDERFVCPQWSLTACVTDSLVLSLSGQDGISSFFGGPHRLYFTSQNAPMLLAKISIRLSLNS